MGLCIRPFGILIAGDRECHDRALAIKEQNQEHHENMAWANNSVDGQGPLEGILTAPFDFLSTAVKNDPLSKLVGGLFTNKDAATGVTDTTPLLLLGAGVVVVGVVILTSHKKK